MSDLLSPAEAQMAARLYDSGGSWEKCAAGAKIFQTVKKSFFNTPANPAGKFAVHVEEELPALAWLCEIREDEYSFIIGPGVEHGKDFIVEGAWDGDFREGGFVESDHFYGSGACLSAEGKCVFAPPRTCVDYLFVLHDAAQKTSWVSNSFNFILARAEIDQQSPFYKAFAANLNKSTNEESALGADRGSPLIARLGNLNMYRMMYHNFSVDSSGHIEYLMRLPDKLPINNFSAYRDFLLAVTKSLLQNSSDPVRKNPFTPISMLSTGYDSCASSAIASACGVKDAVTLDVKVTGHNDCGENIAAALGMRCRKVASPLGKNVPILRAELDPRYSDYLEFMATAGIGDNLVFKAMEPLLKGRLVFSGLYGDGCWSKEGNGSGLAHHLPYMKSRMEFRLRTGYCLVPPPAFGAYFPYFLNKINQSQEMLPFSLNNNYDRPIPRRIAEEAGVPRDLFGMRKAANNPDIVNWKGLFDTAVGHVMKRYQLQKRAPRQAL